VERELGELRGEVRQMCHTLDRVLAISERQYETAAASSALIERVSKELDRHDRRLNELEAEQLRQGGRLDAVEGDLKDHIEKDIPLKTTLGEWAVRVVWGSAVAAAGAIAGAVWEYFRR
jgi:hypothetical protein